MSAVVTPEHRILFAATSGYLGLVAEFDLQTEKLNPEFGSQGTSIFEDPVDLLTAIAVEPDGRIKASAAGGSGSGKVALLALEKNGKADPAFNNGLPRVYDPCAFFLSGCSNVVPQAVEIDAGGRIVMGGSGQFGGEKSDMWAMRVRPDGSPDTEFGSTVLGQFGFTRINISKTADASARGMALQGERVVLGGTMASGAEETNSDFALVRLADGSLFRDGLEDSQ